MTKILKETSSAVLVENTKGFNVWVAKSMIVTENDNLIAAKKFIVESKELEGIVDVDDTIGMKVILDEENVTINVLSAGKDKKYTRKAYGKKKYGKTIFGFKTGIFAIPTELGKLFDRTNGLVKVGSYEEGCSLKDVFDKMIATEVENTVEIIEKAIEKVEEPDWSQPVKHKEFETIKICVKANIPIYLYGPAGSGKNFTLMDIANELGLEFYFTNSVQQEYKITGFIDAGGVYHETEFYKAFTNGGLFFLDEMDASIPEVLVLLNAAIANGYFEFPNGKVYAHKKFRVVAAGNTIGSGADEQYTGRLVLDQATLDRFVPIKFDYDRNIEMSLAKGDKDLVDFIEDLRARAKQMGIRATFSYRCIITVIKLQGKLSMEKIIEIGVLKGMDEDTMNTLKKYGSTNKYYKILEGMAA